MVWATFLEWRLSSFAQRSNPDLRSTKVTRMDLRSEPMMVSPSQSPKRERFSTQAGRCEISIRLGIVDCILLLAYCLRSGFLAYLR